VKGCGGGRSRKPLFDLQDLAAANCYLVKTVGTSTSNSTLDLIEAAISNGLRLSAKLAELLVSQTFEILIV
jgi:hypothetical protein